MLKKQLHITFLLFGLFASTNLFAAYYSYENTSYMTTAFPWIDISSTSATPGTSVALADDQLSSSINLGFTFNFSGTNYTSLKIMSNGPLEFGTTSSTAYANTTVASSALTTTLIPYWDDLNPNSAANKIMYRSFGTAPNRYFVVSFINVNAYNSAATVTFQTQIYESGKVVYRYGAVSSPDGIATTGYYFSSSDYVQYSYGNASTLTNGLTVLWTPPAKLLTQYRFEETSWNGTSGEVKDSSGANLNATTFGSPLPSPVATSPARGSISGTCDYASLPGPAAGGGSITMTNLPVDTTAAAKTSVSFWMYWDGTNNVMPIGWQQYALKFSGSFFGFHSGNNDIYGITSTGLANGWHHVVAIFTNGNVTSNQLYIDGVNKTLSQQIDPQDTGNAVVKSTMQVGGWTSGTGFRFSGRIDEVKVYNGAVSASTVATLYNETHTCQILSTANHIRLLHNGSGLTCAGGTITVQACADANCNSLFNGSTTVTLASTAGTWSANPVTFNGSTTASLAVTSAGNVTIGTSAVNPAVSGATRCFSGAIETCLLNYADTGFQFNTPDHVSETSQTITISAVQKATGSSACTSAFASKTRSINFVCAYTNPSTGTLPARIAGTPLNAAGSNAAACDGTGKTLNFTFDATGIASTTVQYADVGQMQLSAKYTGSAVTGDTGLVMTGSDTFIAAPAGFTFSAVTAAPIKAGNAFNATVSAVNNAGAITPNFGRETAPESAALTRQLVQPTGTGANPGSFSGTLGQFTSGSATSSNLTWNEVGIINLTASLSSGSYLSSGYAPTGTSANIGAFVPDHFTTSTVQGCSGDNFTYSGQPFSTTITAKNAADLATQNYDGSANTSPNFAKLVTLAEGNTSLGAFSPNTVALTSFAAGIANANPTFSLNNIQTAPSLVYVRATDTNASSSGFTEGVLRVFSGRLSQQNANGSELLDLPVPLQTEIWSSNGNYYELNDEDNCTQLTVPTSASGLTFGSPLVAGQSTASINGISSGTANVISGNGNLILTKPSTGNTGYVDISVNAPSWLKFNWQGTGNANPSSRATFGIYKGDSNIIYMREVY